MKSSIIILSLVLAALSATAQQTETAVADTTYGYKDAYKDYFSIGVSLSARNVMSAEQMDIVRRNLTAIMLRMVIIGRLTILLWAIASARSTSGSRLFAYMHLSIMPSLSPATKESTLRFQLPVWLLRTIIVTAILIPVHSPSHFNLSLEFWVGCNARIHCPL